MKRPPTSTSLPFVRIAGFFIPIDAVISDLGCGLHRRRVGKKGWISKWELHNLLFLQRARQPNRYPFSSIYRQSVPSNRNSLTHAEYSATSTDLGTDKYRIDPPPSISQARAHSAVLRKRFSRKRRLVHGKVTPQFRFIFPREIASFEVYHHYRRHIPPCIFLREALERSRETFSRRVTIVLAATVLRAPANFQVEIERHCRHNAGNIFGYTSAVSAAKARD